MKGMDYRPPPGSGGGGGSTQSTEIEHHTLSAGDITAKQITLGFTPNSLVGLWVKNGISQFQNSDFSMTGAVLSWNGLDLDGVLVENDKIMVIYTRTIV